LTEPRNQILSANIVDFGTIIVIAKIPAQNTLIHKEITGIVANSLNGNAKKKVRENDF